MREQLRHTDWWIIGSVGVLLLAGLATMMSFQGETPLFERQLLWISIGTLVAFIIAKGDVRFLRDSRYVSVLYSISLLFLILVLLFGKTVKGAQSWFDLGAFSLQPTDFAKLFIVLVLAKYFARRHVAIGQLKHLLISALYVIIPVGLVLLQPDFGSTIIIGGIWLGLALVAGIARKHIAIVFSLVAVLFASGWLFFFEPYQKARIVTFFNPTQDIRGAGYNAYQSLIAVGSGGVLGKGLGYGTQSRLNFLPEYETDFVFAAFSEEWGFIGSTIVIAAFLILFWRLVVHAMRGGSNFETLFCVGYAMILFGHFIVNVGMNIGVMPVTGLPLPFMSYGGSHIIAELIGLGVVLSMTRYERAIHRDDVHNEFVGYA
jgi:rod shape determining protein RodA